MKNTTDTVAELREFVATQAAEDAVLPVAERRHQAALVRDVLNQQVSNTKLLKELLGSYSGQVTLLRR